MSLTSAQISEVLQRLRAAGITPDPDFLKTIGVYDESYDAPKPQEAPLSDQLPKEQLLLKLLKMTTSSNDGEALTAIRKVNSLLTDNGWDWDRFVAGKIKIVANPFVGLGTPTRPAPRTEAPGFTPPSPPPPPPPKARYSGQKVRAAGINKFADNCYCCGIEVMAQMGGFFNPQDYNLNARSSNPRSKFSVVCKSCEGVNIVWDQPAPPIRKRGRANINDLA